MAARDSKSSPLDSGTARSEPEPRASLSRVFPGFVVFSSPRSEVDPSRPFLLLSPCREEACFSITPQASLFRASPAPAVFSFLKSSFEPNRSSPISSCWQEACLSGRPRVSLLCTFPALAASSFPIIEVDSSRSCPLSPRREGTYFFLAVLIPAAREGRSDWTGLSVGKVMGESAGVGLRW